MKHKSEMPDFKVGERVRLIADTLAWKAEMTLQGKIGEVTEHRDDGRVTVCFDNGRLLMGRDAGAFERVGESGPKVKANDRGRSQRSL